MHEPTATMTADVAVTSHTSPSITNTNMDENDESVLSTLRKSALQDNIERKGKNAYYFAHSHKATGPKWDGKVEPKLLSRMSLSENQIADIAISKPTPATSSFDYGKSNITTYAFLDDGAKIKIYIDMENVGKQCTENDVALECTDRTLSFTLQNYMNTKQLFGTRSTQSSNENQTTGSDHCDSSTTSSPPPPPQILRFGKLCNDICDATYRMKKDKIVITLTKADPSKVWHNSKKTEASYRILSRKFNTKKTQTNPDLSLRFHVLPWGRLDLLKRHLTSTQHLSAYTIHHNHHYHIRT